MAKSVFDAPQFKTEEGAFAYVEARLWPTGPACYHCGNCDETRIRKMQGKTTRLGLYKCNECRKPFTVRMGTIFESSHLSLHLWLQVIHLMCASKKGISTRQIQRMLQCSMKTAWFLTHRIREAMRSDDLTLFGTDGGIVEADETFISWEPGATGKNWTDKRKVLSLIDRDSGKARSMVIDKITVATVTPILQENIAREAHLMTDDAGQYRNMHRHFASHNVTAHVRGQYVDPANPLIHSNTVEGYFSIFKRGMKGVYQHCAKKHLHRYLVEFDFRYSNRSALGVEDVERAEIALRGVIGKRLTYKSSYGQQGVSA